MERNFCESFEETWRSSSPTKGDKNLLLDLIRFNSRLVTIVGDKGSSINDRIIFFSKLKDGKK